MDIITQSLLDDFRCEQSFPSRVSESVLFEHFSNFCVLSKEYGEEFNLDDVHTGKGGDGGSDGIGILVNGNLINSLEELEDLARRNRYIDADFIFVQAKTSSSFDGSEIGNFLIGITRFFGFDHELQANREVREKRAVVRAIYKQSSLFKNGKPRLKLYYVCTGQWNEDEHLKSTIRTLTEHLRRKNIFEFVDFHSIDADSIQKLYRDAKNSITKTIKFEKRVTIPKIKGIKEAYLGILPVTELLKLLTDDYGIILKGAFYDNVRDFQGDNEVNHEIRQTVNSDKKNLFVLLNNGVTIVADFISTTGDDFNIQGFQVVNGCQTSHVLYNNRDQLNEDMYVPTRLIVSEDENIENEITKATNRQTPVKPEELIALTDFQKKLEQYYLSQPDKYKLYYERRSQQYRSRRDLKKIQIVSVSSQIRSFSSMFLDQTHRAGRYYGTLLKSVQDKIFNEKHKLIGYYVSAYANYKLDALIRKGEIHQKYKPFKYVMLMALRIKVGGLSMPPMESKKFEKYCQKIRDTLWNDYKITILFREIGLLLDEVVTKDYDRAEAKTADFVKSVQERLKEDAKKEDAKNKNKEDLENK